MVSGFRAHGVQGPLNSGRQAFTKTSCWKECPRKSGRLIRACSFIDIYIYVCIYTYIISESWTNPTSFATMNPVSSTFPTSRLRFYLACSTSQTEDMQRSTLVLLYGGPMQDKQNTGHRLGAFYKRDWQLENARKIRSPAAYQHKLQGGFWGQHVRYALALGLRQRSVSVRQCSV